MTHLPTFAERVADTDILLIQRHSVEFSFTDILVFNGNRYSIFPLEKRLRKDISDGKMCPLVIILTLGGFNLLLVWTISSDTIYVPQNPGFILLKLCILFLLFNTCVLK